MKSGPAVGYQRDGTIMQWYHVSVVPRRDSRMRLRVRPGILRCACVPYNSTQHEPDHRENDERCMIAAEIFVVFDKAAATVQPAVGTLYDPALGQHVESLACVRTLDDLEGNAGLLLYIVGSWLALVAAISDGLLKRREPLARNGQQRRNHVAVLHVTWSDRKIDQETDRIDGRVAFLALDFLARVISSRINFCPPFSALFTVWLSTIASVGVAALPSSSRTAV